MPIVPSFLLHLDRKEYEEHSNRSTPALPPHANDSVPLTLVDDSFAKHAFSLAAVANSENSRVGWLLSSKAIVQLVANPFVGPLCSRQVFHPLIEDYGQTLYESVIELAKASTQPSCC